MSKFDFNQPWLAPVSAKHGLPLVKLVFHSGIGGESAQELANYTQALPGIAKHIRALVSSFNYISSAYATSQDWDSAALLACERDFQLAFASRIVGADGAPLSQPS